MKIRIREASETQADDLLRLYEELHNYHAVRVPERLKVMTIEDVPELREQLQEVIKRKDAALFTAEVADDLVGVAEVYLRRSEGNAAIHSRTYGHLQNLMVTEHYRGSGVGRQLLLTVNRWARERGATEIEVDSWEFDDGPLEFYTSRGYRTLKRTLVRELGSPESDEDS